MRERYPNSRDPVRLNGELFVALRNKVEHRYEHNLKIVTGGRAQALVMNYEQEMVAHFGPEYSLADRLRFPISLQALTAEGREQLQEAAKKLPKQTRDLVAKFEAAIDPAVLDDLRYDYRVRLVPIVGPKTDADLAINFVKLDELSEDERKSHGRGRAPWHRYRSRTVRSKWRIRTSCCRNRWPVSWKTRCPSSSAFTEHAEMWRRLEVGLPQELPIRTTPTPSTAYTARPSGYVYTPAWVKKIIKEIGTVEKYRAFFGKEPRMK